MIDIFADIKPQPKLYIADVTVNASYKPRKNSKKIERVKIELSKVPIVLHEEKFPTDKMRKSFLRKVFDKHIKKGDFDAMNMQVVEIKNIKFSSDLAYKFDYAVH